MRKIVLYGMIFVLMIGSICYATEETPVVEQSEEVAEELWQVENVQAEAVITIAGEVEEVQTESITDTIQNVTLEILNGEYETEEFQTQYVLSYDIAGKIEEYPLKEGDKVIVQISKDATGTVIVTIQEVVRNSYLYLMFSIFVICILLVCGRQGIKNIASLAIILLVVYFVLIKGIYAGFHVVVMTILAAVLITGPIAILNLGFYRKTITAFLGTLGGVISCGIISVVFSHLAKISGATAEAVSLSMDMVQGSFNFRYLFFASIAISSLGACMDIGMTMAIRLDEIKNKTEDISWKRLFRKGMSIGKEILGTKINTLILFYGGGMLTLLLLFLACNMELFGILSKESIAEEIMASFASGIGVVLTVPITAFVDAKFNCQKTNYKMISDNKIDGKRSLKL